MRPTAANLPDQVRRAQLDALRLKVGPSCRVCGIILAAGIRHREVRIDAVGSHHGALEHALALLYSPFPRREVVIRSLQVKRAVPSPVQPQVARSGGSVLELLGGSGSSGRFLVNKCFRRRRSQTLALFDTLLIQFPVNAPRFPITTWIAL